MGITHRIGIDYTDIVRSRRAKRELPLLGRLKLRFDIGRLQNQLRELLAKYERQIDAQNFSLDPASTEHSYNLKNSRGELFVQNYEEVYRKYSVIGLQELTSEAREAAKGLPFQVSDLSPVQRLKGMTDTSHPYYHPYYDERNYTQKTRYCEGYLREILESFTAQSSRSAVVVLYPGEFLSPHFDIGAEYITRLQIPIFTNPDARLGVKGPDGWNEYFLPADGHAYFINAGYEHYAINNGLEPRFQLRVCLNGQEDLEAMTECQPLRKINHAEFSQMPFSQNRASPESVDQKALREFHM